MTSPRLRSLIASLFLAGALVLPLHARPPASQLADFFGEGPQATAISPSGEWLAFSARESAQHFLFTRSIVTGVGRKTVVGGPIDQLVFVNDSQVAFRTIRDGNQMLGIMNFEQSRSFIFTPDVGAKVSFFEAQPPPWQSGKLFFKMEYPPEGPSGLRYLQIPTDKPVTAFDHENAPGSHSAITDWIMDPEGSVIAVVLAENVNRTLAIPSVPDSTGTPSWHGVFTSEEDDFPQFSGFGAPRGQLVAAGYLSGNYSCAVLFDPATRQFGPPILGEKDANIRRVVPSPDRRSYDAYVSWKRPAEPVPLTENFRRVAAVITQIVGDSVWEMADVARDYAGVLVVQTSDTHAPKYWHIDIRAKRGFVFHDQSDKLAKQQLPVMKPITIRARDGLPLPGFEILPKGLPAKAPVLVFVGGGPFDGVRREWSPMLQALASQRMAVVTVNYRGARGFGRAFYQAGYGQATGAMIDDVEDVMRYLRQSKEHSRRPMVVVGVSFGGFLSASALARGLVKADGLILFSSLIDPADFFRRATERAGSAEEAEYQRQKFFGVTVPTDRSLLSIIEQLNTPQLVIHGLKDEKIPVGAARDYAQQASKTSGGADWVEIQDDHELAGPGSRLKIAELIAAFVQKHGTH